MARLNRLPKQVQGDLKGVMNCQSRSDGEDRRLAAAAAEAGTGTGSSRGLPRDQRPSLLSERAFLLRPEKPVSGVAAGLLDDPSAPFVGGSAQNASSTARPSRNSRVVALSEANSPIPRGPDR